MKDGIAETSFPDGLEFVNAGELYIAGGSIGLYNAAQNYGGRYNVPGNGTLTGPITFNFIGDQLIDFGTISLNQCVFNGSSSQNLYGSGTISQLTINNSAGVFMNNALTITSNLDLQNGIIHTDTGSVVMALGSTIIGATTNSYVDGNMDQYVDYGNASVAFHIGDPTYYTPVFVQFTNVTNPGYLRVHSLPGDHAQVQSSMIDELTSVNRH